MMFETANVAVQSRYNFFLYGAAEGIPKAMASRLRPTAPDVETASTISLPLRELSLEKDDAICRQILASCTNIVWVGLGSPKQGVGIAEHVPKLLGYVLVASGATFDFFYNRIQQAPRWMQASEFEWIFRLFQDPARLRERHTVYNVVFLGPLILDLEGLSRLETRRPRADSR